MAKVFSNINTLFQGLSDVLELKEFDFDTSNDSIDDQDFKKMCSWLLTMSPHEITLLATILGFLLSLPLSTEEKSVIASVFGHIGSTIGLIASQEAFLQIAEAESKKLFDLQQFQLKKYKKKENDDNTNKLINELKIEIDKLKEKTKEI